MTHEELRQAAIDYLAKAFSEQKPDNAHLVQAAVSIVLTPKPKSEK